MSNLLNDYFLSLFTWENHDTIPAWEEVFQGEDEKLRDVVITRHVVWKDIEKLKKNKSPGPDGIYPRVIKGSKDAVSGPLSSMFRKSVTTFHVATYVMKGSHCDPII